MGVARVAPGTLGGTHGMPLALTSFVGRAAELTEVAGLLKQYRLVTVTGPGGVGKTRLAGEVARQVAGRFTDGVWLVELASVADAAQLQALTEVGDLAAARRSCAGGLAQARQASDLHSQALCLNNMAELDRRAGQLADATAHLREGLEIATRIGNLLDTLNCLDQCGHVCAAAGRWADTVTIWAARAARVQQDGLFEPPQMTYSKQEPLRKAAHTLGPSQMRAAEERGAAMTLAAAAEFATMLTHDAQPS